MPGTGATPDASFRLLVGLWATPAPAFFSVRISPSSMWTQWAANSFASSRLCRLAHGMTGIPFSRREFSTSNSVSERCVCSGTSNSMARAAQARMMSGVQV
jgi:hypothetical protein